MAKVKFLGNQEHDETKMVWAFCATVSFEGGYRMVHGRVEGNMRADGYANMMRLIDAELPEQWWRITMLDFGPDYPR